MSQTDPHAPAPVLAAAPPGPSTQPLVDIALIKAWFASSLF